MTDRSDHEPLFPKQDRRPATDPAPVAKALIASGVPEGLTYTAIARIQDMAGANVIDYIAVRFEALRGEIASLRRELRLAFILLTATFGFVGVQFPLMYWQGRDLGVLSGGQNMLIEDVSELKQELSALSRQMSTVLQELAALRRQQAANARPAPGSDASLAGDPAESAALPRIAAASVVDAPGDSP